MVISDGIFLGKDSNVKVPFLSDFLQFLQDACKRQLLLVFKVHSLEKMSSGMLSCHATNSRRLFLSPFQVFRSPIVSMFAEMDFYDIHSITCVIKHVVRF